MASNRRVVLSAEPVSFEKEFHTLLRSRLRLVFTVGALVAVAAHVFYVFGTGLDPEIDTPFAPHIVAIYDLYLVSVGLGALLLYMRRWSLQAWTRPCT